MEFEKYILSTNKQKPVDKLLTNSGKWFALLNGTIAYLRGN